MITAIDKAIVGGIIACLATLNSKYGFHFDTGDQTGTVLSGLVDAAVNGLATAVLVYVFPNKGAAK